MHKMIGLFLVCSITVLSVSGYEYDQYYNSVTGEASYPQYVGSNYSSDSLAPQSRFKRTFTAITTSDPLEFGVSFSFKVPITTLDSKLSMSLPFTWDYPTSKRRRSSSGRSLDGGFMEDKVDIYKAIETVMGKATGIDGHSCLLRSICEVAVAPEHEDGVMGDIVNTLLTVSNTMNSITHVKGTEDVYVEAQAIGQATSDCTPYFADCPMSLFNLIAK